MRPFAIALAATIAVGVEASIWDSVIAAANNFLDTDITQHPVFDFHFTGRHDAKKTIAKYGRRIKPLTPEQRIRYEEAHHSIMARRMRLGLASSPVVRQDTSQLNTFSGFFMNVLKGMAYNAGNRSRCIDAAESFFIGLDTGTDALKKMYIPAYWAEIQVHT